MLISQIENVDIRHQPEIKNNQKTEKDDVEKGVENENGKINKSEGQQNCGGYQFKEVSYSTHMVG